MYVTADAMQKGCFFWSSLTDVWPMPFLISEAEYAVLEFGEHASSIVVCQRVLDDGGKRFVLQLWQHPEDAVALDVTMDEQMGYLSGASLGMALDELGAVTALRLLLPGLVGSWSRSQLDMDLMAEGEHV